MNADLAEAVTLLQARLSRYKSRDYWRTEQAEEALNLLLAELNRKGDAKQLVRNALADARKKLARRAEILSLHGAEIDWLNADGWDDFPHLLIETSDLLERRLSREDQALLNLGYRGEAMDMIAFLLGVPIKRIREKLSRARARARIASGRRSRRVSSVRNTGRSARKPGSPVRINRGGSLVLLPSSRRAGSQAHLSQVEHRP
jgi:hypothetical protein